MRKFSWILVIIGLGLIMVLLSGCGSFGPNSTVSPQGKASTTITFKWPERVGAKMIPAAANSIKVVISKDTFTDTRILNRPYEGGTSTAAFDTLPVGLLTITATAYPQADAQGVAQATASTTVNAEADTPFNVTLTMASAIERVDITSNVTMLCTNSTGIIHSAQLTATPKDHNGNIVLISSGGITWQTSNDGFATVDSNGRVTSGNNSGVVTITATESESGKNGIINLPVKLCRSGQITGSETWSGIIYLTGDITVKSTGNLTIQPGTRIEAKPNSDDQVGGIDTSRVELIVEADGTLDIQGTSANPILFTSGATIPQRGNWYGLRILSTKVTINNFSEEYGIDGLRVEAGPVTVNGGFFRKNNEYGIYVLSGNVSSGSKLTLTNSSIDDNYSYGIQSEGGPITVDNCIINNNWAKGISFNCSSILSVTNSTISNTVETGGWGWDPRCGITANNQGTINISNSTIKNNPCGIFGNTINVSNSIITSNGLGILIRSGSQNNVITNNLICNNNTSGICIQSGGQFAISISGNLIANNQQGIATQYDFTGTATVTNNDIFDNIQYEFSNNFTWAVTANGNFWGEPTTLELNNMVDNLTKIYDSHDSSGAGQVLITSWASQRLTSYPLP